MRLNDQQCFFFAPEIRPEAKWQRHFFAIEPETNSKLIAQDWIQRESIHLPFE